MFKIMSIENAEIDYSIDSIPTLINHNHPGTMVQNARLKSNVCVI